MVSKNICVWHAFRAAFGITVLVILMASGAGAATLTVDDSGGADYTRIQDAIDNANDGDTILVQSGTYYENVNVTKQLILRGIDDGGGKPVVDANGIGSTITLISRSSTLEGFKVTKSGYWEDAAINVKSDNNIIKNNTVSESFYDTGIGIFLDSSDDNTMIGNNITNFGKGDGIRLIYSNNNMLNSNNISNVEEGIQLITSTNNTVLNSDYGIYLWNESNNKITNNFVSIGGYGIYLYSSSKNSIMNNTASNYTMSIDIDSGFYLEKSSNNTLIGNVVSNSEYGIIMYFSSNNTLSGNIANSNNIDAIHLEQSHNNTLSGNNASNNGYGSYGIALDFSNNNTLSGNIVSYNSYGIFFEDNGDGSPSSNNLIYKNNLYNNTDYNAYDLGNNQWDNSIIGNHYSNFDETSEGCSDIDNNGICDSSVNIPGGSSVDRYPLVSWGTPTPAPQNFTFVHLTDVHIGYFPKAMPTENNNATYMNYSVNNFTDTLQTIKRVNPDFILITGDLVEYDKKDFFMAFKNLLKGISIPVKGITPGNHDRRDKYSGLLGNNLSDYNKYIKPISNPASIDNNYSFDFKGYRFIGLDSGADYNVSIYDGIIMENMTTSISLSYDPSPESNGLSNEQMTRLLGEFNNTAPKIVFMHHPVMDYTNDNYPGWPGRPVLPDGAPGGNNGAIAFNRWDFINYTRDSNVQLVLTGHSHYDAIFNLSGKQVKNSSSNRPLFIQTRSATNDGNMGKGFRIVEVKDGKANPYNSVPTPRFNRITIAVQFPPSIWYALNVYDSNGRHTGMNADCSDIELGIPDSYYTGDYGGFTSTPQVIVSYSGLKKLNVSNCLSRTSSGSSLQNIPFNLTLEYQTETSSVKVNFNNVTARSLEATDISKP